MSQRGSELFIEEKEIKNINIEIKKSSKPLSGGELIPFGEDQLLINDQKDEPEELSALKIMFEMTKQAIPMMLSFTFTLSVLFTSIIGAHLSKEDLHSYLAASALIAVYVNFVLGLPISLLLSMPILASKKYGELTKAIDDKCNSEELLKKIKSEIADIFKGGIVLSVAVVPFPFLLMYFSKAILTQVFKQDEHISGLAQQNLRPYSFAALPILWRIAAEQMMYAFNKATPAMFIGLTSFAIGTGLACLLSFGPTKLGLAGIAYGYLAEAVLTCLGYCLYIAKQKDFEGIPFFNFFKPITGVFKQLVEILKMGLSILGQMGTDLILPVFTNMFAGWIGKNELAAQNFATQLFVFTIIPSMCWAQVASQGTAREIGRGNFQNAMRFARYGLATGVLFIAFISILFAIKPEWLTLLYSSSVGKIPLEEAKLLIPLAGAQAFYDTATNTMIYTLRSANNYNVPTLLKIVSLWVGVLAAFILGFYTHLGIYGIGIGSLLGFALAEMLLCFPWVKGTSEENLRQAHAKVVSEMPSSPESSSHKSSNNYGICNLLGNCLFGKPSSRTINSGEFSDGVGTDYVVGEERKHSGGMGRLSGAW